MSINSWQVSHLKQNMTESAWRYDQQLRFVFCDKLSCASSGQRAIVSSSRQGIYFETANPSFQADFTFLFRRSPCTTCWRSTDHFRSSTYRYETKTPHLTLCMRYAISFSLRATGHLGATLSLAGKRLYLKTLSNLKQERYNLEISHIGVCSFRFLEFCPTENCWRGRVPVLNKFLLVIVYCCTEDRQKDWGKTLIYMYHQFTTQFQYHFRQDDNKEGNQNNLWYLSL